MASFLLVPIEYVPIGLLTVDAFALANETMISTKERLLLWWKEVGVPDDPQPDLDILSAWYNHVRPHQGLAGLSPAEAWNGDETPRTPYRFFSAWNGILTGYGGRPDDERSFSCNRPCPSLSYVYELARTAVICATKFAISSNNQARNAKNRRGEKRASADSTFISHHHGLWRCGQDTRVPSGRTRAVSRPSLSYSKLLGPEDVGPGFAPG